MKWQSERDPWRKCFAFLPITAGTETIWLQRYWRKFNGEHYLVDFGDRRPALAPTLKEMDHG